MVRLFHLAGVFLFLVACLLRIAGAQETPIAIVTDLQGNASLSTPAAPTALGILNEIKAHALVQVGSGTRMVVLYYANHQEFVLRGPAMVHFGPQGVESVSGLVPERGAALSTTVQPGVSIRDKRLVQAGTIMRGSVEWAILSHPSGQIVDLRPEFGWSSVGAGASYTLTLRDQQGRDVFEATTGLSIMALPQSLELTLGAAYSWQVAARTANGHRVVRSGKFQVANADMRDKVNLSRPAEDAGLSQWIAYALWLEQTELKDDARKVWQRAQQERPDDQHLRRVLGNR